MRWSSAQWGSEEVDHSIISTIYFEIFRVQKIHMM